MKNISEEVKLGILINYTSSFVFEFIYEIYSYENATTTFKSIYVRPKN